MMVLTVWAVFKRLRHWPVVALLCWLGGPVFASPATNAKPLLQLQATFSHPSSSGFVIDPPQAYFSSPDGRHRLFLDAWPIWLLKGPGPSLNIYDLAELPSMLRLRWFSSLDDQFWSIYLPLPQQKLRHYVQKSLEDKAFKSVFNRLVVTVSAEGKAAVWLANNEYEIQLTDGVKARKTDLSWSKFTAHWPQSMRGYSRAHWLDFIESQTNLPYYNLRFARVYGEDAPAVDVSYAVYTVVAGKTLFYCGRTDAHGHTREFISFAGPQTYHMIDDADDVSYCSILDVLDDGLAPESMFKEVFKR